LNAVICEVLYLAYPAEPADPAFPRHAHGEVIDATDNCGVPEVTGRAGDTTAITL
jgi:hypothetical protein